MSTLEDITILAPKYIFVIYLIISGNFMASLFGCRTQDALNNNMWLKHLLGFMTMYFFVILVDSKSKWSDSPRTQFLFTSLFYIIFIITTRMDYKWWVAFIIGLCLIYILNVYKEHDKTEDKDRKTYETYQQYLIYIVAVIICIGFIIYYGRKKLEYGDKFDYLTFFLGKTSCSFNREPIEISDYQAFITAFS